MSIKLKDCCSFQEGYVNPSQKEKSYFGGTIKWLRTMDLNNAHIYDTSQHLTEKGYLSAGKSAFMFPKNSIAISKSGTIGELAILDDYMCGNRAVIDIMVDSEKADLMYVFYTLKYKKKEIISKAVGSIQKNLYVSALETITLNEDNLQKQQKIAGILSGIDNKIDNNNNIITELDSIAKTIYDYWFLQYEFPNEEGKPYKSSDGKMVYSEELKREIPVGWKVKEVQDYCNIFTGKKDVNQALDKGKYKFFSCSPDYKYSNDKLYEGKAILISGNGSYTGRTIFVNDSFDLYQRTYACTNNYEKDYMEYIYYSMLKLFVPRVGGGTHGSAIPYIVYNDIAKQQIVMDETIVEKFTNIIKECTEKIINLNKENEELTKLRDELLPLLMNGQVSFKN